MILQAALASGDPERYLASAEATSTIRAALVINGGGIAGF